MKDVSDWSELPRELYVTSVARDHVVFWIEACSVPMAIGPELRLVRADLQAARIAALEAQLVEAQAVSEAHRHEADICRTAWAERDRLRTDALTMRDLLPCPRGCLTDHLVIKGTRNRWVSCIFCGWRGPVTWGDKANAIAAWNTRAPSPPPADAPVSPWQPVETCPNLFGSYPPVDLWSAQGFRMCNCQIDVVEYRAVDDPRPDRCGWTDADGHGSIEDAGPFTHWMPRPAPPPTDGGEG